jgi:hypothetical protein
MRRSSFTADPQYYGFVRWHPCGGVPSPTILEKMDSSDRTVIASARLVMRAHKILSDRTLSGAPDCISQLGCDSYASCKHNPNRRPAEGRATAVPDDALGNRRRYIF